MEHNILQRRSAATTKNMGVNSYSQIISAFRAQGDLTENQLTILPALQNAFGISRERHTAEVKRALYDEHLSEIATSINPSPNTTNWEIEANYACPTIVHRPPNTKYIQLAEHVLQTTPPTTIIQHPQLITTTKLNHDLQQLVNDEIKQDGIRNATHQQLLNNNTSKQNLNTTDINSSKVIRLVRAKQAPKRKSSLDTLIEVVQKELLRVNEQANTNSPSHYTQIRSVSSSSSKIQNPILTPHRSIISSVLPSSHPSSLTSQTNHSFKITRKRGIDNFNISKRNLFLQQRNKSFNDDDNNNNNFIENDDIKQTIDDIQSDSENIEEIVRDTVDKLVAITLLNNAPFIVNMLTAIPSTDNSTNTESKIITNTLGTNNTSTIKSQSTSTISKSDHYRNDHTLLSSIGNDLRNSLQQTSPMKQQQQIHHSQLIIQPTTTTPISTIQGTTTPTLFVTPRILNFQTVVPKPTTNIQIGNTKIILVSPSNITQHLPHSTTSIQPTSTTNSPQQQQQNLVNNSPVKLVKFATTNNNNNSITTRSTTLPINTTQTSTLTLPKNVQIVIPSQTPSTIQLTRTHSDDLNKSLPTTTTFRPVTTVPMALTTCTVDQIPQAAQEITITTSPISSPPLTTNTSDLQQQSSLGTTINVISSNSNNQSQNNTNSQQQSFLTNSSENNNNNNNNGSTIGKSRRRSSSSASIDKPVGKILRPIAKVLPVYSPSNSNNDNDHATIADNTSPTSTVQQQQHPITNVTTIRTSPTHDEMIKSVTVNFQPKTQQIPRPSSTHGPMIYRMTSVNPNVPVFRVRAATTPTSTTVINKSIKTETKPISVTTATNMCYESKPTHTTPPTSGSVSVLACFKTTKKRNKERAIMPRPSTTDSNDTSQEFQQRLNTILNTNTSLVLNNDITNSNSSSDYRQQSPSTPTRLVQQTSLSSTLSDDNSTSNIFSLSMQEQNNDTTTSSSNSIPISRHSTIQFDNNLNSIKTLTTPNISPSMSPIQSLHSTPKPLMEDKCIQCINHKNEYEDDDISMKHDEIDIIDNQQIIINSEIKKRSADDIISNDESWTIAADSLLRNILSQYGFRFLDVNCQQNLSSKFDIIQTNLVSGVLSSKDEFYNSVLDIKRNLLNSDLSKISEDNLEKLFNYFEIEFQKICDQTNEHKRIRRQ
ncbi:unnamed protein product [Rotaria sordida]|uniref:ENT domain-containing protein n=1 Tax=Rotaria sordida TaxID=392033 RepID=A0A814GZI4_9BILA|nr:unnamed protein product [Rotaria sordida]